MMAMPHRLVCGGACALVVVTLGAAFHTRPAAAAAGGQAAGRRTVDIVAERFLFVPSDITVDAGTTLEIRLTSEDTDHGFRIVDSDINVVIPKRGRGEITVTFAATTAGDYEFECSHMCGAGHSFMRGRIRVKPVAPAAPGATP